MTRRLIQLGHLALLAAGLLGFAVTAEASTMTLDQLLVPGGMIQVGDKWFDEFSYQAGGDMPDAVQINVIPISKQGKTGLRFQGPFLDLAGNGASDALLTFRVTVHDDNFLIAGATLAGNPSVLLGDGTVAVTETFLPSVTNDTLDIFHIVPGGFQQLQDSVTFNQAVTELFVQKDILAFAETGAATLSFFDQTFQQVPEPASLWLAGLGIVGLLFTRRKVA